MCQSQRFPREIIAVNVLFLLVNIFSQCFMSRGFSVCLFYVISYIVLLIHFTIFVNINVIVVFLFNWLQLSYNAADPIFSMHSHSYFKIHLQYNHIWFYQIPTTVFNFTVTRFFVEKIAIIRTVSQVFYVYKDTIVSISTC